MKILEFSFDIFPSWQVHFDYFSVDFDEEHSAFYGGVLNDQVDLCKCIYIAESDC